MVQTYFALAKLVQNTKYFGTRLITISLFYNEFSCTKFCQKKLFEIIINLTKIQKKSYFVWYTIYEVILMKELEKKIVEFAEERDWLQFNTPENLAKSIAIESGELLECFQWNNNYDKEELKYEIADVMNYCILLCHQIGVDPKNIILEKMDISAKKYPIEKAKGKSTKYDKL